MSDICPCRAMDPTPIAYAECCKPYLEDGQHAPTAEALMRSRYSAFVRHHIDHLEATLAPGAREDFDRKAITHWSRRSQWLGLEILSTEGGQSDDKTGYVEFVAHFIADGERHAHRERSLFRHDDDGRWYFQEEANQKKAPIVKGAQPGRNDPCPCGSGAKFKKCCGAAA